MKPPPPKGALPPKGPPINFLVTVVASKMRPPDIGKGWARNPEYTLKRTIPMSTGMNAQLEKMAAQVNATGVLTISTMQLAALILEMALDADQDESITEGRAVVEVPS